MRREEARKLAFGGELGLPTKCHLGRLSTALFCQNEAVIRIGKIRVCAVHWARLEQIAREAGTASHSRKPVTSFNSRVCQ